MAIALILATALLLACGPASEAEGPAGQQLELRLHQESEPTATPTSAPTPTPAPTATSALTPAEKYPRLDTALQKIVGAYESGTQSEAEAASQAPEHHGPAVLIAVEAPTGTDATIVWMAEQEISPHALAEGLLPPTIYAYASVSSWAHSRSERMWTWSRRWERWTC